MAKVIFRILLDCFCVVFVLFFLVAGMASCSQMLLSAMKHNEIVGFTGMWLILNMLFYLFLMLAFRILSEKTRDILMLIVILFLVVSGLLLMFASIVSHDGMGYTFSIILWLLAIWVPIVEAAAQENEFTLLPC